jgi:hypothetical protein
MNPKKATLSDVPDASGFFFLAAKKRFVLAAQVTHHLLGLELDDNPLEQRLDDRAFFFGEPGCGLELQARVVGPRSCSSNSID